MNYHIGIDQQSRKRWDEFLARMPNGNFRQTSGWGTIRKVAGWEPVHIYAEKDGEIRAALLIFARRIPYLGLSLFYGCRGPTFDWDDVEAIEALMQGVREAARRHHAILLRVDPEPGDAELIRSRMTAAGFLAFDREYTDWNRTQYELRIDLTIPEDEYFSKTIRRVLRQRINSCYKNGISIEEGLAAGDELRFFELMSTLETVKNAVSHDLSYYTKVLHEIVASGGTLLKAKFEGKTISAMAITFVGNRCWAVYIANDYAYRKMEPNKLVLWEGIKFAYRKNCTFFDMGATQGKAYDPEYPLDSFKLGFRPEVVRFPGFFDLAFKPVWYTIFTFSEFTVVPWVMGLTKKLRLKNR